MGGHGVVRDIPTGGLRLEPKDDCHICCACRFQMPLADIAPDSRIDTASRHVSLQVRAEIAVGAKKMRVNVNNHKIQEEPGETSFAGGKGIDWNVRFWGEVLTERVADQLIEKENSSRIIAA